MAEAVEVRGGVLFDVDGTLLIGSVAHLVVLGETLGRWLGRPVPIRVDGERPMLGETDLAGWIDAQVVRHVLASKTGADDERAVADVMDAFREAYLADGARTLAGARVVAGAVPCLERLADAGIPVGLVTGNASFVARAKFEALGIDRFFRFDRDLGFGDWRAERDAVAHAAAEDLARRGVDAGDLVYVGDTPRDMRAARSIGARAVGVLTGTGTAEQLSAAGADAIVASVAGVRPAAP